MVVVRWLDLMGIKRSSDIKGGRDSDLHSAGFHSSVKSKQTNI